jgi:hypothetical protein
VRNEAEILPFWAKNFIAPSSTFTTSLSLLPLCTSSLTSRVPLFIFITPLSTIWSPLSSLILHFISFILLFPPIIFFLLCQLTIEMELDEFGRERGSLKGDLPVHRETLPQPGFVVTYPEKGLLTPSYHLGLGDESPNPDELTGPAALRRVSAPIPWSVYAVAFVELCERFSYYGTQKRPCGMDLSKGVCSFDKGARGTYVCTQP